MEHSLESIFQISIRDFSEASQLGRSSSQILFTYLSDQFDSGTQKRREKSLTVALLREVLRHSRYKYPIMSEVI
jgi:hypothetical protein